MNDRLKSTVIAQIYTESSRSGKPVFCIVDDTIASKTKPSSQALHPIEATYFHQSHLKGKQDYTELCASSSGCLLTCNGIVLNYFLCDSWYLSETIINAFAKQGFHTIGALKINRILYPYGIKKKLCDFATLLVEKHSHFDLDCYVVRWSIEVFFRQCKQRLALDSYQICSFIVFNSIISQNQQKWEVFLRKFFYSSELVHKEQRQGGICRMNVSRN